MRLIALIFALAFTSSMAAQSLPDAPSRSSKLFWVETAAYTTSNVMDGLTTARNTRRGLREADFPRGSADILGSRPSGVRYALVMGSIQVVTEIAAYKLERSHSRVLRLLGHGMLASGTYAHFDGYILNMQERPPFPSSKK